MGYDLIDRAKLLANTENYVLSDWGPAIAVADIEEADREDAALVRHGEWLLLPADIWDAYECSVCKKVEDHPSRFCPNCGAQMNLEG